MKKSYLIGVVCFMATLIGFGLAAQSFTTVNSSQYWGKTGIPALTAALDANFGALGTTDDVTFNDVTVSGTLTSTNLTTTTDTASGDWNVTSNLIVGGTTDTDSITVDAGAGIDCQAAGTLEIGVLTADQINVGITAVETDILGTLNVTEAASFDAAVVCDTTLEVTGVATLTSAPVLVAVTAAAAVTATMTNAPTLVDATAPVWINVTIGGEVYVVPAFQLDD